MIDTAKVSELSRIVRSCIDEAIAAYPRASTHDLLEHVSVEMALYFEQRLEQLRREII